MKTMSVMEAIREAMSIRMREDPNVLLFGEDVREIRRDVSAFLRECLMSSDRSGSGTPRFPRGAIIGAATGSAATGLRPIAEIMMDDFITVAMDQLVNNAAFMHYMFGGKIELPMVVRTVNGAGVQGCGAALQVHGGMADTCSGAESSIPVNAAGCARVCCLHRLMIITRWCSSNTRWLMDKEK